MKFCLFITCVCVEGGVYVYSCVWTCGHTHMSKPEVNAGYLPLSFSTLVFETSSLTEAGVHWVVSPADPPQESSRLHLLALVWPVYPPTSFWHICWGSELRSLCMCCKIFIDSAISSAFRICFDSHQHTFFIFSVCAWYVDDTMSLPFHPRSLHDRSKQCWIPVPRQCVTVWSFDHCNLSVHHLYNCWPCRISNHIILELLTSYLAFCFPHDIYCTNLLHFLKK